MRTTINIPKDLLEEAMKLTGAKTRNQLIMEALEEKIKPLRRKQLFAMKGTIDLDINLDRLRDRE